ACPLKGLPIGWLTVPAGDVGAFRRHDKYRLTAENCREAAYKMAPQAPYLASAAVLYNSLGRRP
ncbi:hypothetical protein, partial [Dialister succinatiphilus]|uniref:hypothetical protein n=1 Tax=Dialister succinatiphilus TaxID=487173 RepID=UPI004025795F